MAVSMVGCVNQHPEGANSTAASSDDVRIVATSPATADICDRLELDLVGVCSSLSAPFRNGTKMSHKLVQLCLPIWKY